MIDNFFNFDNSILIKDHWLFDFYFFMDNSLNRFNYRFFYDFSLYLYNLLHNRHFNESIYNFLNLNFLNNWFFNDGFNNLYFLLDNWSFSNHFNFYNFFQYISHFNNFLDNLWYFYNSILSFNDWNYFFNNSINRHLFNHNLMLN